MATSLTLADNFQLIGSINVEHFGNHNLYITNTKNSLGIKIVALDGLDLSESLKRRIEAIIDQWQVNQKIIPTTNSSLLQGFLEGSFQCDRSTISSFWNENTRNLLLQVCVAGKMTEKVKEKLAAILCEWKSTIGLTKEADDDSFPEDIFGFEADFPTAADPID